MKDTTYRRPVVTGLVGLLVALAATAALSSPARADVVPGGGDVPPVTTAPAGMFSVRRGVQGPEGLFHSRVLLHMNMSKDSVAKPISLAPDFYYGVTDSLHFGLLHNLPMGWLTRPGAGFCLSGDDGRCPRVYNNVGFDLMYGLVFGDVHFSLHSTLYVLSLADPTPLLFTLGLTGKLHLSDGVALFLDPQVGIAVSDRDAGVNDDMLFLPAELQFQLSAPVALKLLSGVTGQLDAFGDTYQIPVGLGLVGNVSESFDIGLRFAFDNLLGQRPDGVDAADQRSLSLLMHLRF
ncbi:MAG TPA: hypothetical protein VGF45_15345 [Polyangia bacterium]